MVAVDATKILVAGGRSDATNMLAKAEVYDAALGTWSAVANMKEERYQASATVSGGKVLVAGGLATGVAPYSNTGEVFDPATGAWTLVASTMSSRRGSPTATTLLDARIIVVGGADSSGAGGKSVDTTSLFGVATGWSSGPTLLAARSSHTTTRLDDGRLLVVGGVDDTGTPSAAAQLLNSKIGAACTLASDCASGFCVDSVCCDTACTAACTACSAAKKGSGSDGTCQAMTVGVADTRCTDSGASSCGTNSKCGSGACAYYPAGTSCRAPSCTGSTLTAAASCPGAGAACPAESKTTCPFGCSGSTCADAGLPDADAEAGSEPVPETGPVAETGPGADAGSEPTPDSGSGTETGTLPDSSSPVDTGSPVGGEKDSGGACGCQTPGAVSGSAPLVVLFAALIGGSRRRSSRERRRSR